MDFQKLPFMFNLFIVLADQHSFSSSYLQKYYTSQRQSESVTTTVEYKKDTLVDRVETLVDR